MNTLLLNVARDLRYRTLNDLIGHDVTISDRSTIPAELLSFVSRFIDGCAIRPRDDADEDLRALAGAIAKYGILDVEMFGPSTLLDDADNGVSLLRDLGFLPNANSEPLQFDDDPEYCIRELQDGIAERQTFVLLFLQTTDSHIVDASFPDKIRRAKDPLLIEFPITFTVKDACATNTSFAWFNKHFYLERVLA